MNESLSPPALLRSAAVLIERALRTLDLTWELCPGCGAKRFHQRAHAFAYQRLKDVSQRLRDQADRLD